ncbi:MAG: hypothetical protein V1726_08175 [Methanobacteriota archaeon]
MDVGYIIMGAAISINALVLLLTSFQSYRKYHNVKLVFIILVFLFFFIRGVFLSLSVFYEPFAPVATSYYPWVIDMLILNLLYVAALKK